MENSVMGRDNEGERRDDNKLLFISKLTDYLQPLLPLSLDFQCPVD